MILVDFSQLAYASIHISIQNDGADNVVKNANFLRHLLLRQVLTVQRAHRASYGKPLVLACDSHSWRKDMFKYYKWSRYEGRKNDDVDWTAISASVARIEQEIKDVFPYAVIKVDGAEGDDVIAVLAREFGGAGAVDNGDLMSMFEQAPSNGKKSVLIVSSDHDYKQLHDYADQWCPRTRKYIRADNPAAILKRHIIGGDSGDGIPNILSDDDTFAATNKRQKPIRNKTLDEWMTMSRDSICTTDAMNRNWDRNALLVDLSRTPVAVKAAILREYDAQTNKESQHKLLEYFNDHRLRELASDLQEFV